MTLKQTYSLNCEECEEVYQSEEGFPKPQLCHKCKPKAEGKSRSITFTGRRSGDCECFCWDDVPEKQRKEIVGERRYALDKEYGDRLDRLYPGTILDALGVRGDRNYEFIITIKETP